MTLSFWSPFVFGIVSTTVHANDIKPQNTIAKVGDSVNLTCCFNDNDANIGWSAMKGSVGEDLFGNVCIGNSCRGDYRTDNSSQNCSRLIINATTTELAGLYRCTGSRNGVGLAYGSYLVVYDLNCRVNVSFDDELVEGDVLGFWCDISWKGKIPFEVSWKTEGTANKSSEIFTEQHEIYRSSMTLRLKRPVLSSYVVSLSFIDSGITDTNIDKSCPVVLIGWTSPRKSIMFPVDNVRVSCPRDCRRKAGSLINCSADGYPSPQFTWTNWDDRIVSNGSVLVVGPAESSEYTCVATNTIRGEKHEKTKKLTVIVNKDECPSKSLSPKNNSSELSNETIISIAVAVFGILLLLVGVLVILRRQKKGSRSLLCYHGEMTELVM